MKITLHRSKQGCRGSVLFVVLIIVLIVSAFLASVGSFVVLSGSLTRSNNNLVKAEEFAEGGAVIAVGDLNTAITNNATSGTLGSKLTAVSYAPYMLDGSLGGGKSNVYVRTISSGAPFSNQAVNVQIWMTNIANPNDARIVATATVGSATKTAVLNAGIIFGYGAAILSVNDGTAETGASKSVAQDGNVAIDASGQGPTVVYGGSNGMSVLANGRVNLSSSNTSVVDVPASSISMTNYAAGTPIPDYTDQGTSNTLFDINRFIAVANATTNGYAPSGNNHFTNLTTFAASVITHRGTNPMQGVIVVDVATTDKDLNFFTTANVPNGINVEGSLVFNFIGSGWNPTTSKIIIDTPVNVNPANLSGLVATNPATFTSGYPPTYTDSTKNPANINISPTYQNFSPSDDLPALFYTIGVVDLHNSLNICGVMYTPSYMEIENKHNGDTQYISGQVIAGNGVYLENTSTATTVITFDLNAVQNLATAGTAGKSVYVQYWQ